MQSKDSAQQKQWEALSKGASQFIQKEEFFQKLDIGRPLTVKAGFDPTRPDIHLGHLVLINKLRKFQDLGHRVVFVAGDWTARIGDPSGRNKTRPRISKQEAESHAKTYIDQACLDNHPFRPYPPDLQKEGEKAPAAPQEDLEERAKKKLLQEAGQSAALKRLFWRRLWPIEESAKEAVVSAWRVRNWRGFQRSLRLHQGLLRLNKRKTKFVRNSQWLKGISLIDFIEEISQKAPLRPPPSRKKEAGEEKREAGGDFGFTLAHILSRKEFSERYKRQNPIGMHELFYPFVQAYDSLHLKADVEIGGEDQLFNLLFARDFQAAKGEPRQCVMALPLLEGLDGSKKMSKSLGNTIDFKASAKDMFGKVMSVSDELMIRWWKIFAGLGPHFERQIQSKALHAMEEKKRLAFGIAASFHGPAAAIEAMDGFSRLFSKQKISLSMPERPVEAFLDKRFSELMMELELAPSISAARRLIVSGALRYLKISAAQKTEPIDKESLIPVKDPEARVSLQAEESMILKSGKRNILKLQGAERAV